MYAFETEQELYLTDDSPIRVEFNDKLIKGEIISSQGYELVINIYEDIGEHVRTAEFTGEPWELLVELQKRLIESKGTNNLLNKLGYQLLCKSSKLSSDLKTQIFKGQDVAIKSASNNDITIIWGPPGTGKTYTLAQIAIEHFLKGNRILILSHSNIAVDVLMLKIYNELKDIKKKYKQQGFKIYKGDLLRYGIARNKEVLNKSILSSELVLEKHPELKGKKDDLENKKKEYKKAETKGFNLYEIEKELKQIRANIKSYESELLLSVKILDKKI